MAAKAKVPAWRQAAIVLSILLATTGVITVTDLFSIIGGVPGFEVGKNLNFSGDTWCGTECEATINLTHPTLTFCFEHPTPEQEIWTFTAVKKGKVTEYKSLTKKLMGAANASLYQKAKGSNELWVNLNHVKNIILTEPQIPVDWLILDNTTNEYRPLQDGDCWHAGQTASNKLVGYRPFQRGNVKWSFMLGDNISIDPWWNDDREFTLVYSENVSMTNANWAQFGECVSTRVCDGTKCVLYPVTSSQQDPCHIVHGYDTARPGYLLEVEFDACAGPNVATRSDSGVGGGFDIRNAGSNFTIVGTANMFATRAQCPNMVHHNWSFIIPPSDYDSNGAAGGGRLNYPQAMNMSNGSMRYLGNGTLACSNGICSCSNCGTSGNGANFGGRNGGKYASTIRFALWLHSWFDTQTNATFQNYNFRVYANITVPPVNDTFNTSVLAPRAATKVIAVGPTNATINFTCQNSGVNTTECEVVNVTIANKLAPILNTTIAAGSLAIDATSQGAEDGGFSSSVLWQHTIGSGTNRMFYTCLGIEDNVSTDSGVRYLSYNGINMTFFLNQSITTSYHARIVCAYLNDSQLPIAGTYDVTGFFAGTIDEAAGGSISFINANQTHPFIYINSSAWPGNNTANVTVQINTTNSYVLSAFTVGDTATNGKPAGSTVWYNQSSPPDSSAHTGAYRLFASTGKQQENYTSSSSNRKIIGAFVVSPFSGTSGSQQVAHIGNNVMQVNVSVPGLPVGLSDMRLYVRFPNDGAGNASFLSSSSFQNSSFEVIILQPGTPSPYSPETSGTNVSINYSCTSGGTNLTSGCDPINVTIAGIRAAILNHSGASQSFTYDSTPYFNSTVTSQDHIYWNNTRNHTVIAVNTSSINNTGVDTITIEFNGTNHTIDHPMLMLRIVPQNGLANDTSRYGALVSGNNTGCTWADSYYPTKGSCNFNSSDGVSKAFLNVSPSYGNIKFNSTNYTIIWVAKIFGNGDSNFGRFFDNRGTAGNGITIRPEAFNGQQIVIEAAGSSFSSSNGVLTPGQWMCLAIVRNASDGSNIGIYANGTYKTNMTVPRIGVSSKSFYIGNRADDNARKGNFTFGGMSYWNQSLSAEQINAECKYLNEIRSTNISNVADNSSDFNYTAHILYQNGSTDKAQRTVTFGLNTFAGGAGGPQAAYLSGGKFQVNVSVPGLPQGFSNLTIAVNITSGPEIATDINVSAFVNGSSPNIAPTQNNPIILPDPLLSNVSAYIVPQNVSDNNNDNLSNISDWIINGSQFFSILLPFDTNNGSRTQDYGELNHSVTVTRNASFNNFPAFINGSDRWRSGFYFDGSGGYLSRSNALSSYQKHTTFSIMFAINLSRCTSAGYTAAHIFDQEGWPTLGLRIYMNTACQIVVDTYNKTSQTGVTFNANSSANLSKTEFYILRFDVDKTNATVNTTNITVYKNGVRTQTSNLRPFNPDSDGTQTYEIGFDWSGGLSPINGSIMFFGITNQSISDAYATVLNVTFQNLTEEYYGPNATLRAFNVVTDGKNESQRKYTATTITSQPDTGIPSANLSFGPTTVSVFRWGRCGPQIVNTSSTPQGQNSTHGIDLVCNNGTGIGTVKVRLNAPPNQAWTIFASNTSPGTNLINLSSPAQAFYDAFDGTWDPVNYFNISHDGSSDDRAHVNETIGAIKMYATGSTLNASGMVLVINQSVKGGYMEFNVTKVTSCAGICLTSHEIQVVLSNTTDCGVTSVGNLVCNGTTISDSIGFSNGGSWGGVTPQGPILRYYYNDVDGGLYRSINGTNTTVVATGNLTNATAIYPVFFLQGGGSQSGTTNLDIGYVDVSNLLTYRSIYAGLQPNACAYIWMNATCRNASSNPQAFEEYTIE